MFPASKSKSIHTVMILKPSGCAHKYIILLNICSANPPFFRICLSKYNIIQGIKNVKSRFDFCYLFIHSILTYWAAPYFEFFMQMHFHLIFSKVCTVELINKGFFREGQAEKCQRFGKKNIYLRSFNLFDLIIAQSQVKDYNFLFSN